MAAARSRLRLRASRWSSGGGGGRRGRRSSAGPSRPAKWTTRGPILLAYPDGGRLLARGGDAAEPFAPRHGGRFRRGRRKGRRARASTWSFPCCCMDPSARTGPCRGLLELAGLPYVGAGVVGSAAAMDKAMMKRAFRAEGLPVMDYSRGPALGVATRPQARVQAEAEGPSRLPDVRQAREPRIERRGCTGSTAPAAFPGLVGSRTRPAFDTKVLVEAAAIDSHEIECAGPG